MFSSHSVLNEKQSYFEKQSYYVKLEYLLSSRN